MGEAIVQVGTSPSVTRPHTHSERIEFSMAGIGKDAPGSDIMIVYGGREDADSEIENNNETPQCEVDEGR